VRRVLVGGLATDYCVLNTVKDAIKNGFEAYLLMDAIRAVNVKPDDGARAEDEMRRLGAKPLTLAALVT
jgi:nicotinamidase/pyrazinamidase